MAADATGATAARLPLVRREVTVLLPSRDEELHFEAGLVIEAWWSAPEPAPSALLDIGREGVTQRAEEHSRRRTLTSAERLRGELSTVLLRWEQVAGTPVHARGHCVSIDTDAELVAAVAQREDEARTGAALTWQNRLRAEQAEQMCTMLLDPLRATAWWYLDNRDKPEQAVTMAQQFRQLRDTLMPELTPDSAGGVVDEFLTATTDASRLRLISVLCRFLAEHGREDLVARLPPTDDTDAAN